MSIDPDPINERRRTVSRSELKMNDTESVSTVANTDDAIDELLNG